MRISMAAVVAMYARIYGSSNGHVCAYLWQQQWPCMRISMAAAMAMYAHIYGPCMRVSMAAVMAMYARISIVVVMAM